MPSSCWGHSELVGTEFPNFNDTRCQIWNILTERPQWILPIAWPLRKDDTHKSRRVHNFFLPSVDPLPLHRIYFVVSFIAPLHCLHSLGVLRVSCAIAHVHRLAIFGRSWRARAFFFLRSHVPGACSFLCMLIRHQSGPAVCSFFIADWSRVFRFVGVPQRDCSHSVARARPHSADERRMMCCLQFWHFSQTFLISFT